MTQADDRVLVEAAAKAAGLEIDNTRGVFRDGVGGWWLQVKTASDPLLYSWNPLLDSRDALWLSTKLRIDIVHNEEGDKNLWVMAGGTMDCVEDFNDESIREAATRRAVVRAAARLYGVKRESSST